MINLFCWFFMVGLVKMFLFMVFGVVVILFLLLVKESIEVK